MTFTHLELAELQRTQSWEVASFTTCAFESQVSEGAHRWSTETEEVCRGLGMGGMHGALRDPEIRLSGCYRGVTRLQPYGSSCKATLVRRFSKMHGSGLKADCKHMGRAG